MKKLSTEEFISRSKEKHGDRFDYSKTEYISAIEKVIVTCRIHGDFPIIPSSHMNGTGCAWCSGKAKKTTEIFVKEMKALNGDKYDYSNVEYINSKTPIHVVCDKGHSFYPTPNNHSRGFGCSVCYGHMLQETEDFLKDCRNTHGNLYDYSLVDYKGSQEYIKIICKKHGVFEQLAHSHKTGQGCPKCQGLYKSTEDFIEEAKEVHGDLYDYSEVEYIDSKINVTILCKEHGEFSQTPNSHLRGSGCPVCSGNIPMTTEQFITKAKKVHGDIYDYSKTIYGKNNRESVIIICKDHGEFTQTPMDHLQRCGCPNCNSYGRMENDFREFIKTFGFDVVKDRSVLDGKEIDVYIPALNLGFEFNGVRWHSEKFVDDNKHKTKTDLAKSKGVRLIHIYEDDWEMKQEIVKKYISRMIMGVTEKLYARKCNVLEITSSVADQFMNDNHTQGKSHGNCSSVGLMHEDKLVAVMQFSKVQSIRGAKREGEFELTRFATSVDIVGGAGKLFKHFVRNMQPESIISYSDNDMFEGGMYKKLGFSHVSDVPPDYKIVHLGVRKHKSNFKKSELAKRYPDKFDPSKTEHENCLNLGLYRVYNSGLKKWLWTLDNQKETKYNTENSQKEI